MENVGKLNPGVSYVYERVGNKIYAREVNSSHRTLIGEDYEHINLILRQNLIEEWLPIIEQAQHSLALQDALDRAKVIYELIKQEEIIQHHPV